MLASTNSQSKLKRSQQTEIARISHVLAKRKLSRSVDPTMSLRIWSSVQDNLKIWTDLFQRRFGLVPMVGFACTVMVTWEASFM